MSTSVLRRAITFGLIYLSLVMLGGMSIRVANAALPAPGGLDSNLALWLKADAGITANDGDPVSAWEDQSDNAFTAANNQYEAPIYLNNSVDLLNFNPVVHFTGTTPGVDVTGLDLGDDFIFAEQDGAHVFAVVRPAPVELPTQFVYDMGGHAGRGYNLIYGAQRYAGTSPGDHGGALTSDVHTRGITPTLASFDIEFGQEQRIRLDGTEVGSAVISLAALTATQVAATETPGGNQGPVTIGHQAKADNLTSNGGRWLRGDIAEVVVYNNLLDSAAVNKVESYLAIKYGITLLITESVGISYTDSAGTVLWDADANAAYHNDVAGIASDSDSGLLQPRSKSVNLDALVTMSGTVSSALMWGNNDGSLTIDQPFGAYFTMARVWAVQETPADSISTVSVGIPASVGATYLMVDDDTDFSDATVIDLINDGNGNLTADVDFADGQFFTFGVDAFTVTTNVVGGGIISLDPTADSYLPDTVVTATAAAAPGYSFAGWTGDLGGATTPSSLPVDGDKVITATFTLNPPLITGPEDGITTTVNPPPFTGTGVPGVLISITDGSGNEVCSALVDANGDWTCTPDNPVGEGQQTFTATGTDGDGNESEGTQVTIIIGEPDTDGDRVPDAIESEQGTDPNDPTDYQDSDNDKVPDHVEEQQGTDPGDRNDNQDTDGGDTPDYVEETLYPNVGLPASNPTDPSDDDRDTDLGGLSDYEELVLGNNANNPDDDAPTALNPSEQPAQLQELFLPVVGG